MKVLIADFDLFHKVGGGQTVYKSLIEAYPDIQFHYLIKKENPQSPRPKNAIPIVYKEYYRTDDFGDFFYFSYPSSCFATDFVRDSNIAASVEKMEFDVVDIPEYTNSGFFIESALRFHGVDFGRTVLSLHGRVSMTARLGWAPSRDFVEVLEIKDRMQYLAVDLLYGISNRYVEEVREKFRPDAHFINPMGFIKFPDPLDWDKGGGKPSLYFVGRTEKCKGPDIFADIVWWLPKEIYGKAFVVGPEDVDGNGKRSTEYLQEIFENRGIEVEILPPMPPKELKRIYSARSVVVLPSRYDTLNLVSLEALFSGCPVAIGSGAMVCSMLNEYFPEIPYVFIDLSDVYNSARRIQSVLENYDEYRTKLFDVVSSLRKFEKMRVDIKEIYGLPSGADEDMKQELWKWYLNLMKMREVSLRSFSRKIKRVVRLLTEGGGKNGGREKGSELRDVSSRKGKVVSNKSVKNVKSRNYRSVWEDSEKASHVFELFKEVFELPENSKVDLSKKLKAFKNLLLYTHINRIRIWDEIVRIERRLGNELSAALYMIRVMRSLGKDEKGYLPYVIEVLSREGYAEEAKACQVLFGGGKSACSSLIGEYRNRNRHLKIINDDYEIFDDRRSRSNYRVTVVVSLYNAADKLARFLRILSHQTLLKNKEAEVVIIETGSPAGDYGVFRDCMKSLDIEVLYARTPHRETIQSAWNRGISLSRGPYLTFLGVDEMIVPDCLNVLADELDKNPNLDWVQGSSVVTSVDSAGRLLEDIMPYDRRGYRHGHFYLDTCYLAYVGGMYRKSIHSKFGFYDPSFKAAGDTEFKSRVMPFIKTGFVDRVLGVYWNYPEERATQGPRAELEDLRAWHLYRSLAGVEYAFSSWDLEDVVGFFFDCLGYRKSYCQHLSTDVELALNVLDFLGREAEDFPADEFREGLKKLISAYRALERPINNTHISYVRAVSRAWETACEVADYHERLTGGKVKPAYMLFNDNRYEQHIHPW